MKKLLPLVFLAVGISCTTSQKEKNTQESTTTYRNFQYLAEEPVDGTLQGVVLLGGAGFDSFIILIDSLNNWTLEKASYGESGVMENQASLDQIKSGLENYISSFIEKGVDISNIHFVISSTAASNESLKPIISSIKDIGYLVNEVTESDEAEYSYLSTMPKGWENEGYVMDIGSGNTKIAWQENGAIKSVSTYGSKYHLMDISEKEVLSDISSKVDNIPDSLKQKCFLIGGAPYQLAKAFDEYTDRYTVLKDLGEYSSEDQKAQNGLKILQEIQENTGTEEFIFDWNSNFSIGFLIASQAN